MRPLACSLIVSCGQNVSGFASEALRDGVESAFNQDVTID